MMVASASTFPGYPLVGRLALIAWATGAVFLPLGLANRLIATSRTSSLRTRMGQPSGRR
jgi:hypothetical protein